MDGFHSNRSFFSLFFFIHIVKVVYIYYVTRTMILLIGLHFRLVYSVNELSRLLPKNEMNNEKKGMFEIK